MRVLLSANTMLILKDIAGRAYPLEACALLIGSMQDDVVIKYVKEVENVDRSSISFSIREEDLIRAYEYADSIGLDVVGIFHSHPYSDAYPSSKDIKYMEINQVPWLILSSKGEVRAFMVCNNKGVKELDIAIIE